MNSKELHTAYCKSMTELVKHSKEETKKLIHQWLGKLLVMSRGNVQLFQQLVKSDRGRLTQMLAKSAAEKRLKAQELGKKFGQERAKQ